MEPMTISVFVTPCDWASAEAAAKARAVKAREFLRFIVHSPSLIHRFDAGGVLLFDEFALELHRRGEFFIFCAELRFEQKKLLDLLHARHLLVHALDLAPDEVLHLLGTGQARIVRERDVV